MLRPLQISIGEDDIEISIPIKIAQASYPGRFHPQTLARRPKAAGAVAEPDGVWNPLVGAALTNHRIEKSVLIEIAEADAAGVFRVEALARSGKRRVAVVEPDAIRRVSLGDDRVEVAVVVQISQVQPGGIPAVQRGPGGEDSAIVDPDPVDAVIVVRGDAIQIAIAIEIAQLYGGRDPVPEPLTAVH